MNAFLLILWSNGHSLPYLSKLAFLVGMGTLLFDSIAPPPPLPRWAATLQFVIPTGAQRSGGICGAPLHQATPQPLKPSPFGVALRQRELQIPPLRCPGFPVELGGVGEPHAAFRYESRTRGCVRRYVAGNPGPVGMTNFEAGGPPWQWWRWSDRVKQQQPTGFGLPAFSSTHSASCVVQKAIRTLIWTALILYRPGHAKTACPGAGF